MFAVAPSRTRCNALLGSAASVASAPIDDRLWRLGMKHPTPRARMGSRSEAICPVLLRHDRRRVHNYGVVLRVSPAWVIFGGMVVAAVPSCGLSDSGDESAVGGEANTGEIGTGGSSSPGGQNGAGVSSRTGGRSSTGGQSSAGIAGGSTTHPVTLDGLFRAQCDASHGCCVKNGPGSLPANCAAHFRQVELKTLLDRENTELDLEVLERCILAYENAQTTCTETGIVEACYGLLVGSAAEHEPCSTFDQCDRSGGAVFCRYTEDGTQGQCVAVIHGEEGQQCDDDCPNGIECSRTEKKLGDHLEPEVQCFESEGLYCSREESPNVCRRIHALGEDCESGRSCGASQARCRTTCEPRSRLDEPCATIQRDDCELHLSCQGTTETGKCTAYDFFRDQVCD
jgi:hypothetical protein